MSGIAPEEKTEPAGFTIVLCTRNRAAMLPAAVGSLLGQKRGGHGCRLLIVDNGSTDTTRTACTALRAASVSSGIGFHYLYCPEPGLSSARNAALGSLDSEFVLFFDDDQIASDGWFLAYAQAMTTATKNVACFGGPMHLQWQSTAPDWLPETLYGYLSSVDYGKQARALDPTRQPVFGGNMGFRVSALRRVGGFSVDMGHNDEQQRLLGNEEIDVQLRLHQQGLGVQYVPDASIDHVVLPERLTREWFARRIHDQAVADVRIRRKIYGHSRVRLAASAARLWMRQQLPARPRASEAALRPDQTRTLQMMSRQRFIGSVRGILERP